MTDQEARYDAIAEGYATHWSPVHRPATLALLDVAQPFVTAGARRLLDVGAGTGALATAAVERWPGVQVDGIDQSAGMLEIAERTRASAPLHDQDRLRFHQAPADRLPFADGSFDLVLTSFVLQLVPSRHRALREIRRVLAPGGALALVTWMRGGLPLDADRVYDEALAAADLEPRKHGDDHDDLRSPEATIGVLRRAGFRAATARSDWLDHQFTQASYVAFVTQFDDADLFAELEPDQRSALETDLRARLDRLPASGLRLSIPIVYATGRRA